MACIIKSIILFPEDSIYKIAPTYDRDTAHDNPPRDMFRLCVVHIIGQWYNSFELWNVVFGTKSLPPIMCVVCDLI